MLKKGRKRGEEVKKGEKPPKKRQKDHPDGEANFDQIFQLINRVIK